MGRGKRLEIELKPRDRRQVEQLLGGGLQAVRTTLRALALRQMDQGQSTPAVGANPTGLPQVMDELTNGAVTRTYTYGLQRIGENQVISNTWTQSFYGYDGMGNVRQLTNAAGAVTDTYEYDAFGNSFTVSAPRRTTISIAASSLPPTSDSITSAPDITTRSPEGSRVATRRAE